MKKTLRALVLVCAFCFSIAGTVYAATDSGSALNDYEIVVKTGNSESIYGTENDMGTRASRATAICADYLEIHKQVLQNNWRAEGETYITPAVTWKIAMELELYKNGRIATTASKTKSNTSYYAAYTKYVSGNSSDSWSAEGIFRVFDDNGTKIHEQELYVGM